ncbi:MAG: NAD(P)-binding protein, partial [Pseudomonadota bacterium]
MSVKVAVVGAGPSGCYLAQALRKSLPDSNVTILDRLPIPFGLVRYGVAPDHQGTKAITKQFARLFEREGVAFLGNVELGRDVNLDDLLELFDIVVLATPEIAGLGAFIVALVAAGGLAAALSTASGLLLVISSS